MVSVMKNDDGFEPESTGHEEQMDVVAKVADIADVADTADTADVVDVAKPRFSRVWVYWLCALWMVCIVALAYVTNAKMAIQVFALSLSILGLARLLLPTGTLPSVRSRWIDVATLWFFAACLLGFSWIADAPAVI